MNTPFQSSMLLLGIGGSGCAAAREIKRSPVGESMRVLTIDTDAVSGGYNDVPFVLLGGNRLAGRGTGAQPAAARAAFQDSSSILDASPGNFDRRHRNGTWRRNGNGRDERNPQTPPHARNRHYPFRDDALQIRRRRATAHRTEGVGTARTVCRRFRHTSSRRSRMRT